MTQELGDYLTFFRNRRVFVTGHTGFKGSWLAFILSELGAEVTGFALPPEGEKSHFSLLDLGSRVKHVEGDIRDLNHLKNSLQNSEPEVVFHLAAKALVSNSYKDPIDTISTNVIGSTNLLESVRQTSSVKSLVFVTSDKAYENKEWVWAYRENDEIGGRDPYSASKGAAEIIYSSYFRSFFAERLNFGSAAVRAGNVVGGGDWSKDRLIPDCIRSISEGKPIRLRNPNSTRPWQHVLEPLSGYLKIAHSLILEPQKFSGAWNFGPDSSDTRTVFEVAKAVHTFFEQTDSIEFDDDSSAHEANLLQLNCDKAHQLLSWNPKWDINKTLLATNEWFQRVGAGEEAASVTKEQIREYFGGDHID